VGLSGWERRRLGYGMVRLVCFQYDYRGLWSWPIMALYDYTLTSR
jgi:hypothetical protein